MTAPALIDKKSHVIAWMATLPADDPRLAVIDRMRLGVEAEPRSASFRQGTQSRLGEERLMAHQAGNSKALWSSAGWQLPLPTI